MPGDPPAPDDVLLVHASCVALDGRGVLLLGASGSGKSALALQLMGFGAVLVSDDRTQLREVSGALVASAPTTIRGLIEARGVGLLNADTVESMPVSLVIEMGSTEKHRYPPLRNITFRNVTLPLLHKVEGCHFPAAILQYLKAGRRDPS